ncbi:hypothetical protein LMG29660_03114 [Burkholderia puraquae]|uniref:Uncharacterized protein n=1 Tax=Burkholderia puraquae TaxID=1904757 RepID=A0A6J5DVZ2_9BURK|nr:hypothetical protein LMG29660_03114 [Burkholderia puraquae]
MFDGAHAGVSVGNIHRILQTTSDRIQCAAHGLPNQRIAACAASSALDARRIVTGPRDATIGPHEHGAQSQPVFRIARKIRDPVAPAVGERLKRPSCVEVQQHALVEPDVVAKPRFVGQFEVGNAAAHERMTTAET